MSTKARLVLAALLVLIIPYTIVYIFSLMGNVLVGRVIGIFFFDSVATGFLLYQAFFVGPTNFSSLDDRVRISKRAVRKFDFLWRVAAFIILVGFSYFALIPFGIDIYHLSSSGKHHIVEGTLYEGRGTNILNYSIKADDGNLYSYYYATERLRPKYNYSLIVLPRSRLVLTTVEANHYPNRPEL